MTKDRVREMNTAARICFDEVFKKHGNEPAPLFAGLLSKKSTKEVCQMTIYQELIQKIHNEEQLTLEEQRWFHDAVGRLRRALLFYANATNYYEGGRKYGASVDRGVIARTALNSLNAKKGGARKGRGMCTKCGLHIAQHVVIKHSDTRYLCCQCYVTEGNPPADWHAECMIQSKSDGI